MNGYIQALIDNQKRRLAKAAIKSPALIYEIEDRINELKAMQDYYNKNQVAVKQEVSSFIIKSTNKNLQSDLEKVLGGKYVKNI